MKAIFILNRDAYAMIYGPQELSEISQLVQLAHPAQLTADEVLQNLPILEDVDFIFSGWGGPLLNQPLLDAAPQLKAVFYGSGSIRGLVTPEFWARQIPITSSWGANAVPVAEFTLAEILFSLKRGWSFSHAYKQARKHPPREKVPGAYGSTVGIVSLGMIGRMVCEQLKRFDVKVIAYDPFVSQDIATQLGVSLVSLDEVFAKSDVVSLHTPWLKETEGMICERHFRVMKHGATFINTARGAVVNEPAMIEVLKQRSDLYAILDVTYPEPPSPDSPLFTLPNVVLTPHIAGSMDTECRRMGRYAVEELSRFLKGNPLKWQVSEKMALTLA